MKNAAPTSEGVFEAVVDALEDGRIVCRSAGSPSLRLAGRNAVHGYAPAVGDRVLCTESDAGVFITGVLVARPPVLRAGKTSATLEDGELVVRTDDDVVLVRFDPTSGELRVGSGSTVLALESEERVEIRAPEVRMVADQLHQEVGDLSTEAERIGVSTGRWDLRANKITERAKNVFRDVEALLQTRAGSVRSIARESMSLFANRTTIRSKKDTAVDGERVLLG